MHPGGVVAGNTVYPATYGRFFVFNTGCNYITLENVRIVRTWGIGIGSMGAANHIKILNCQINHCRNSGVYFYQSNGLTMEDCLIENTVNFAPFGRSVAVLNYAGGITQMGPGNNFIFRRCTVINVWGEAVYAGKNHGLVEDCIIFRGNAVNLYLERTSNAIIRNNLLIQDGRMGNYDQNGTLVSETVPSHAPYSFRNIEFGLEDRWSPYYPNHVENNQIYNNIIVGGNGGFTLWDSTAHGLAAGYFVRNNKIYNNTVVTNSGTPLNGSSSTGYGNEFRNNIIYSLPGASAPLARLSGWSSSNNLYYPSRGSTAAGPGDILRDPQLVNVSAAVTRTLSPSNFRISSSTSPAINAGTAVGAPRVDYFGGARIGNPDIGAHEFDSQLVGPVLLPDFSIDVSVGSAPLISTFTDVTQPAQSVVSRSWSYRPVDGTWTSFGGGNLAETFTFVTAGGYQVRLIVRDSAGQTAEAIRPVTVEPGPETLTALFSMDTSFGIVPLTVVLTDSSVGPTNIVRWSWEASIDGGPWREISTEQNPSYRIASAAAYQIRLTVSDAAGATASAAAQTLEAIDGAGVIGVCEDNLVVNGEFEEGGTGWVFAAAGNDASFTVDSGIATIDVNLSSGTPQLFQSRIALTAGKRYYLSFRGRVLSGTASPWLLVREHVSPYTPLGLDERPHLTETWQTFAYQFDAARNEANARLQLMLPDFSGIYVLDNFCLSETAPGRGVGTIRDDYRLVRLGTEIGTRAGAAS